MTWWANRSVILALSLLAALAAAGTSPVQAQGATALDRDEALKISRAAIGRRLTRTAKAASDGIAKRAGIRPMNSFGKAHPTSRCTR